ncbi:sigma-70 family RNA polymerase sigma factor [Propioniciclava tarda]|uniref:Sigma-70 family RNA polymerase sigma factor n=1 Tax=Propioniciclava tarda TaxID=433330 RepID=A0A4V2JT19_PROTD|nr:sigma-70 family RNA polymerase sigma factor [Propioniciclava tarda]TBT94521.1 sigma-70 family RNA polymerase sigma factor [Propioniciclava tarda]SMO68834.1 RNA polymerase primary sigma factor [Propioniciclava tarda]
MNTFNAMTFSEPVLTGEEELRLCREIDAGVLAAEALAAGRAGLDERDDLETLRTWGEVARGRFVRANLKLVQMVTHPVAARTGVDIDDLFQEGVLGLLEAVRRYNPARGARFATFALPWIRMRVTEAAVTRCGGVDLPVRRAKAWTAIFAARNALAAEKAAEPSVAEVAARCGRTVDEVGELIDYVPAIRVATAADWQFHALRDDDEGADAVAVQRLLRLLTRSDRELIVRLYGLRGRGPMTYDELGAELGVSASTVRRREHQALDHLRTGRGVPEAA